LIKPIVFYDLLVLCSIDSLRTMLDYRIIARPIVQDRFYETRIQ